MRIIYSSCEVNCESISNGVTFCSGCVVDFFDDVCFQKDKETIDKNESLREMQRVDDYVPESGSAKNRLKQYLETAQASNSNGSNETGEELPEKGTAKSLLDKWKTIENVTNKEKSPENGARSVSANRDRHVTPPKQAVKNVTHGDEQTDHDYMPQSGTAKNLLNKWQNIDKEKDSGERKVHSITPPHELSNGHDDSMPVEKGYARNALAKYVLVNHSVFRFFSRMFC
jgi:hypothetical protein